MTWPQTIWGDVEDEADKLATALYPAAQRPSREPATGARSMIAFNATGNVFMLMSDARPTRGPGRPKKTDPYAAELRGATIHPVVKEFTAWRLKTAFPNRKPSNFCNATISRSPKALYATGRKAATHHAIIPPLFLHNFWRSIPHVANKCSEKAV